MGKQGESGGNIAKHEKTGRIRGKQKNTRKQGESGENIEKHRKTGRIRGKHRKTQENRENQGET